MKSNNWVLVASSIALVGCQTTYVAPAAKPKATIVFDVASDSTGTTSRHFDVIAFMDDAHCKSAAHGGNLGRKVFSDGTEEFGPVSIVAAERFTFAVRYGESRMGQNRDCSFTAAFLPEAERSYVARFRSVGDVSGCSMTIHDQTTGVANSVQFTAPELSCVSSLAAKGRPKNGIPGHVQWKIEVHTSPR